MVFTDPPYNVQIKGHVCGSGKVRHDEFVMASGEMSEERVHRLPQRRRSASSRPTAADGALIYSCMDWRHCYELLSAARRVDLRADQSVRLEQGQWRHGQLLSLQA